MGKRSVALFDLDKTIYNDHSFFGLVKYAVEEGILPLHTWDDVSGELRKYKNKTQSYSETANKLLEIFVRDLKGKQESEIRKMTGKFFKENNKNFYSYFEKILPKLKKMYAVYLVTTNFQLVAQVVQELFGLDGFISTQFEIIDGKFTGKVESTLANGKAVVDKLLQEFGGETMAFGDSENDIEMLEKVKHAVCINPSEKLLAVALEKGWIVTSDTDVEAELVKRRLC